MRSLLRFLVAFCLLQVPLAQADTVASLLGNFTINQFSEVSVGGDAIAIHYVVVFGQLPALRELRQADVDRDGVTTQAERDDYIATLAPEFGEQLVVTVDGKRVPLKAARWTTSLPTEQGGFSMRVDLDYVGTMPGAANGATHALRFENRNFDGRIGWREIAIRPTSPASVFDATGFGDSLTKGLTELPQSLPDSGALAENAVAMRFTTGRVPDGVRPLALRAASPAAVAHPAATTPDGSGDWLQQRTRQLVDLIATPTLAPHVLLLALLAAMALGAIHAFSPGHGKAVVGAYLVGSRSTPRHAVFLGATVTITHTLVVFLIGFATLLASRFIVPEKLFPILSLLSGLLVLGMGLVLLRQHWRSARDVLRGLMRKWNPTPGANVSGMTTGMRYGAPLCAAATPAFGIRRPDAHSHAHAHDGTMHSHGGRMHSHLPPGARGEDVSWRSLLALGISGGLVPCPSAMVLLLAAIALNKTLFGILLVVAFSVGLAITLTAVGMVFLVARRRLQRRASASQGWLRAMPAVSGVLITLVGLVLCYGAVTTAAIVTHNPGVALSSN